MKRTALYIGFPYTAGLLIASVVQWQLWYGVLGAVVLLALLLLLCHRAVWKYVLTSTLSLLTACCVYWCTDALYVQRIAQLAGVEGTVFSGEITGISVHDGGFATYLLDGRLAGIPARVQYFCKEPAYDFGDTLTLTGTPEKLESTYLFSTEDYYRSQKIFLSMPMSCTAVHKPRAHTNLRAVLYEWRQEMTMRIQARTEPQAGAFMTGLLFGDKSALSGSTRTSLYRVGIGHVLAVSGLHLDFLALCIVRLLRRCKLNRRWGFAVVAVLSILFVVCVGETVSVKRACIMILLSQSAALFFRRADMLNSLSIAMLLLSLENPFVVHSPAFWLSCSGAFGIGVFARYMTEDLPDTTVVQEIAKQFAAMCCVFIAVLPASLLYFREISLISPFSNLLLTPLCMFVLLLEVLAVLLGVRGVLAELLLSAAQLFANLILQISDALARLPWTSAGTDSRVLSGILIASVFLLLLCYVLWNNRRLMRITAIFILVTACIATGTERVYRSRELHITTLGKSRDCTLVLHSQQEAVIVDLSGNGSASDYVAAYLQSMNIRTVHTLFLRSPKPKSIAGYDEILQFTAPAHVTAMELPEEYAAYAVAGCEGNYAQTRTLLFHGAEITVTGDAVQVQYGDFSYACTKENAARPADVLTIYGTSQNVLPDSGLLLVLDSRSCYGTDESTYVGTNNLELTVAADGRCRVRSLYGDS